MQKPEPKIIAEGLSNEELYAWMKEKCTSARLLQEALTDREMLQTSLKEVEQRITSLEAQAALAIWSPSSGRVSGGVSWGPISGLNPILAQRELESRALLGRWQVKQGLIEKIEKLERAASRGEKLAAALELQTEPGQIISAEQCRWTLQDCELFRMWINECFGASE